MHTVHHNRLPQRPEDNLAGRWSARLVDVSLLASLFVVPCLLGGRIALGQLALAVCAACAAWGWSAGILLGRRPTWTVTWVEPLLLAVIGLGLLQITPLPLMLLNVLSPHHRALLPLWSVTADGGNPLGEWRTLSLHLGETREALITGLSYVLLFYVATQRLRRVQDIERMLRWVASASAAMALFGVVQWLSNNGKFFWFYDYPLTDTEHRLKGAFTNRNHFAQFLVLGCAPLLWWILRLLEVRAADSNRFGSPQSTKANKDTQLAGLLLLLGLVVFAVLFSLSRGGMVALCVSLVVMLGALLRIGVLSLRVVSTLLGTAAIVGSLFLMLGYDKVSDRLDNWQSESRWTIWQANVQLAGDFPLFGAGLGSHVEAYPLYLDVPFAETEFTHAENSYLQIASESGLLGLGLALVSGACCAAWCLRSLRATSDRRIRMLAATIAASLAANGVHALFDFVWYVPGLMTVVMLLAACARRLDQISLVDIAASRLPHSVEQDAVRSVPRGLGVLTAAATFCVAVWSFPHLSQAASAEPYWFDYLKIALPQRAGNPSASSGDSAVDKDQQSEQAVVTNFKRCLTALNQVTKRNPDHARAHLRLATAYLTAFEHLQGNNDNPMKLADLRDAALASHFESVDAMRQWLQRAVGPNLKYLDAAVSHSRQAVQLCPLQGQGYVQLAELLFLEDLDPKHPRALLTQAELVRPHSAQVQFVIGREALNDGRLDDALKSWKMAFHHQRSYREQILNLLVGTVPPNAILENLEPDLAALEQLEVRYRDQPSADHVVIARAYAEMLKSDASLPGCDQPIERLLAAAAMHVSLQDVNDADACFRRAIEIDRGAFSARLKYGVFLYEYHQFARAAEHLKWCARINPDDDSIRQLAEEATSRSLRHDNAIQPVEGRRRRK